MPPTQAATRPTQESTRREACTDPARPRPAAQPNRRYRLASSFPYLRVWKLSRQYLRVWEDGKAMARQGTGPKRLDEPTVTAADWAEAALQLIAEAGLNALTVDTLARRLGVTKGSFYWHFKSRQDLLAAALGRWEQRATTESIAGLSAVSDPLLRLQFMMNAATEPPRARSVYAALAVGADDPVVRQVLNGVASARINYLESCYREAGLAETKAAAMAIFAYAAYRGLLQLAHEAPGALPAAWPVYADIVRQTFIPAVTRGPAPPQKVTSVQGNRKAASSHLPGRKKR
ncbi:TetR/AcrR family transcriptional regulator [Acidobacteria bacterium AB60]|nr:TetR/AcrR family transcriptional regulator [Acidobacteria bacterium AB60]